MTTHLLIIPLNRTQIFCPREEAAIEEKKGNINISQGIFQPRPITAANNNRRKQQNEPIRGKIVTSVKRGKTRARERVRSKIKAIVDYFDTRLKSVQTFYQQCHYNK